MMKASEIKEPLENRPYNRIGTGGTIQLPYTVTMVNVGISFNKYAHCSRFTDHASARRFAEAQPIPFFDSINNRS